MIGNMPIPESLVVAVRLSRNRWKCQEVTGSGQETILYVTPGRIAKMSNYCFNLKFKCSIIINGSIILAGSWNCVHRYIRFGQKKELWYDESGSVYSSEITGDAQRYVC